MDLATIQSRHKSFHTEIARRATLVRRPEPAPAMEIPNTPYGVPKYRPDPPPLPKNVLLPMEFYYTEMWFYDLVMQIDRPKRKAQPSIPDIQRVICKHYGISREELISPKRQASVVFPRQVAFYFCKRLTMQSFPDIGRRFGNRDHSTIHHGNKKIIRMAASDSAFAAVLAGLELEIRRVA